jgi:hypothetical protein
MDESLVYTGADRENWLADMIFLAFDGQFDDDLKGHKKYQGGNNPRYPTYQLSLNLVNQLHPISPIFLETGCQREELDVGAGMSTTIFAEYCRRYGGQVISLDNNAEHIERCRGFLGDNLRFVEFREIDSVKGLKECRDIRPALLYLDSLDYPIGRDSEHLEQRVAAQEHCLNEFWAIENHLDAGTVVLLDDNQMPGGGKTLLIKPYLESQGYVCLLDLKQSVWIKR